MRDQFAALPKLGRATQNADYWRALVEACHATTCHRPARLIYLGEPPNWKLAQRGFYMEQPGEGSCFAGLLIVKDKEQKFGGPSDRSGRAVGTNLGIADDRSGGLLVFVNGGG